jgi:hypothetical protein
MDFRAQFHVALNLPLGMETSLPTGREVGGPGTGHVYASADLESPFSRDLCFTCHVGLEYREVLGHLSSPILCSCPFPYITQARTSSGALKILPAVRSAYSVIWAWASSQYFKDSICAKYTQI